MALAFLTPHTGHMFSAREFRLRQNKALLASTMSGAERVRLAMKEWLHLILQVFLDIIRGLLMEGETPKENRV
jgi:hypothetical protein